MSITLMLTQVFPFGAIMKLECPLDFLPAGFEIKFLFQNNNHYSMQYYFNLTYKHHSGNR